MLSTNDTCTLIPNEDLLHTFYNRYRPSSLSESLAEFSARNKAVREWAWAVTSPEVVAVIAKYSPIIEIGAGSGWWASRIALENADIIATDIHIPEDPEYNSRWQGGPYHPLTRMDAEDAAKTYPDRALLLIWPPYCDSMAYRALAAYRGTTVIYIGEGSGGCTANDAFHHLLESDWKEIENRDILQWGTIHDRLRIYRRNLHE